MLKYSTYTKDIPKIEWKLVTYPIKSLKPHPKNPRQMTRQQSAKLEGLIQQFGMIDKPIINKDFTIIGGHQRIKILKKMGAKTVDCWIPDRLLDQMEVDSLCIGLNLHQGSFDMDVLANEWDMLELLGHGFSEEQLLGLSPPDMEEDEEPIAKKKKNICPACGHEF